MYQYNFIANLRFAFQNIHKNRRYLHSLLETLQSTTDLLFVQEAPYYTIRNIASMIDEHGEPIQGTTSHPSWACVSKFTTFQSTQVAIFVNKRILPEYSLFTDPLQIPDPNVLTLTVTRNSDQSRATFVCVYNPPKTRDAAVQSLLTSFRNLTDVVLIQGDFNLHSPIWDANFTNADKLSTDLIETLTTHDLHLVNDDFTPTWHHKDGRSSVLDIIFCLSSLLHHFPWNLTNDITNRGPGDHSLLKLDFDKNKSWRREPYIKGGSDEEEDFINSIKIALLRGADDPSSHLSIVFDQIYGTIDSSWKKNSRQPKIGTNPSLWWNDDCTCAKESLAENPSPQNRARYGAAIRKAQHEYFRNKLQSMKTPWEAVAWTKPRREPPYSTVKMAIHVLGL